MGVRVIVGLQWGDEGKGKVTDLYAAESDIVARFQGGNNAGHTIAVGDRVFKLHLIPSGVFQKGKTVLLGSGMVIDPEALIEELDGLRAAGVDVSRVLVADRAHLILPYHKKLDEALERSRKDAIGTTRRGIGPAYTDKVVRSGLRVMDLFNGGALRTKLERAIAAKQAQLSMLGSDETLSLMKVLVDAEGWAERLRPHVCDGSYVIRDALDRGKRVLLEGAQGALLDIDHGTYPFVTSSNTISGGACCGVGVPPRAISHVIGVLKAYTTRVGEGPFPTELAGAVGRHLLEKGHEYGTTTGRPRRCGWLDLVLVRYAASLNGVTGLAVTKVDVLGGLDRVRVCTAYEIESALLPPYLADLCKVVDGRARLTTPPGDPGLLAQCRPIYEEFPGWPELDDEGRVRLLRRGMEAMPEGLRAFLAYLSRALDAPVEMLSLGPRREETIDLRPKPSSP